MIEARLGKYFNVSLNEDEVQEARRLGDEKASKDWWKKNNQHGKEEWTEEETAQTIRDAIGAEMAVASILGMKWKDPKGSDKDGDLGILGLQIRHTTRTAGRMIVRGTDSIAHLFVFVVGKLPDYTIVGQMPGYLAMKKKYEDAPAGRPPNYFVPQKDLFDINMVVESNHCFGLMPLNKLKH